MATKKRKVTSRAVSWRQGMRAHTMSDVDLWERFRKAHYHRNVKRAAELRRARLKAELTQEEVGYELGITGAAYCYWESGVRNLSADVVREAIKAMTRGINRLAA